MLIAIFLFALAECHIVLNIPEVWGISDAVDLETPLDKTTQNWICAGKSPDNQNVVQLVAGNTYSWQTICGELDLQADGCLVGDWHTGDNANDYSGCALGISYSDYTNPLNHKYLSHSKDCPKRGVNTQFTILSNVKNCDKCVCSFAWAPSIDYSTPQFYHNCFYCSITGGSNALLRHLDFINVNGAEFSETTYNEILTGKNTLNSGNANPKPKNLPKTADQPANVPNHKYHKYHKHRHHHHHNC